MCEVLSLAPDFALAVFAGIGLFFTYRAWRQREDDLHEKYFERRYELYRFVEQKTGLVLNRNDSNFSAIVGLKDKKDRINFLFGRRAEDYFSDLTNALAKFQETCAATSGPDRSQAVSDARKQAVLMAERLKDELALKIRVAH